MAKKRKELKDKYIVQWLFEVKIYALTDCSDNVFYIGCTTKILKDRLCAHLSSTRAWDSWRKSRKDEKIRELDFRVNIKELERFGVFGIDKREVVRNADLFERRWIEKYIDEGIDLCNTVFIKDKCERESKKVA